VFVSHPAVFPDDRIFARQGTVFIADVQLLLNNTPVEPCGFDGFLGICRGIFYLRAEIVPRLSMPVPAPLPILAEVRVSLWIDEMLAWLLPVHFCIDQLLTAEEVVTKVADAFWFLSAWSQIHADEAREYLRTQRFQVEPLAKSGSKYLVQ
jgi:hypothetical protein